MAAAARGPQTPGQSFPGNTSAPTGTLPAGSVERGAINEPIPQPSAKDFFKMHNSTTPSDPQALKDRPVQQDPYSETQNAAASQGGRLETPSSAAPYAGLPSSTAGSAGQSIPSTNTSPKDEVFTNHSKAPAVGSASSKPKQSFLGRVKHRMGIGKSHEPSEPST